MKYYFLKMKLLTILFLIRLYVRIRIFKGIVKFITKYFSTSFIFICSSFFFPKSHGVCFDVTILLSNYLNIPIVLLPL